MAPGITALSRGAGGMTMDMAGSAIAAPLFIGMWVTMMVAMMFPSVAPVAIMWTKSIMHRSSGGERAARIASFVSGYLAAWAGFGLVAFVALLGTQKLVEVSPEGAKWLGVGIFAAAGLYQLTPAKDACLRHCRSPLMSLLHYGNFKGPARDFRVGMHHGLYCVGCCWGLMIVLIAVGVMNIAVMAGLAAVIFLEKLWRRGELLTRIVGVALIAIAVIAVFRPEVLPALHASVGDAGMGAGVGMG